MQVQRGNRSPEELSRCRMACSHSREFGNSAYTGSLGINKQHGMLNSPIVDCSLTVVTYRMIIRKTRNLGQMFMIN